MTIKVDPSLNGQSCFVCLITADKRGMTEEASLRLALISSGEPGCRNADGKVCHVDCFETVPLVLSK